MGWELERAKTQIHYINTLHVLPMQQMNTMKTEITHSSVRGWNRHREGHMLIPPAGSNGACISCTQPGFHGLPGGVPSSQTFWISISKKGNSTYSCPKRCLHQGRREGAWGTAAEVSVASCAAAAQDSYRARTDKATRSFLGPALTLTVDPATEAPLLLGNTLNSNTRLLQFCYREISSLQILLHHLWQLL